MLFGVLLAGLGRFADLLANHLPFIIFVLFNGVQQRLTLVLSKLGIMHVLVPVLLHRAFCSRRESLRDLCPTVSRISHLLKPQLLSRCPGSIGSALLSWRRRDWSCIRIVCGGLGLGSRLRSHLGSRRRGRGRLNLRGGDGRGRRIRDRRRGSRRRGSLSLATRLGRSRGRSLLRRRGTVGRLLRNVHGRLNGGRMMLLWRRRHVWLRSAIGKLHALVPAGHVLLVRRMRIMDFIGLMSVGIGVDIIWHRANLPLLHVGQIFEIVRGKIKTGAKA